MPGDIPKRPYQNERYGSLIGSIREYPLILLRTLAKTLILQDGFLEATIDDRGRAGAMSMTTSWPSPSLMRGAGMREMTSDPPGG